MVVRFQDHAGVQRRPAGTVGEYIGLDFIGGEVLEERLAKDGVVVRTLKKAAVDVTEVFLKVHGIPLIRPVLCGKRLP